MISLHCLLFPVLALLHSLIFLVLMSDSGGGFCIWPGVSQKSYDVIHCALMVLSGNCKVTYGLLCCFVELMWYFPLLCSILVVCPFYICRDI